MPDGTDPTPTPEPADGAATPPAPVPQPKDGQPPEDWEKRYQGAQRVISQRDLELKDLQGKLGTAQTSLTDLQTQLAAAQAEYEAKLTGVNTQLTTLTTERDEAAKRLTTLEAYKVKMDTLRDYPDLIPLANNIPDLPDPDAMKNYLDMMQKGVDTIATNLATRLTAGLVPGQLAPTGQPKYAYATIDEWQTALNKAAGTKEWSDLANAFKKWEAQHKT